MINKIVRILVGSGLGYLAYRRYTDGNFSALSKGKCSIKDALGDAAACAADAKAELKADIQQLAKKAKAATKEV